MKSAGTIFSVLMGVVFAATPMYGQDNECKRHEPGDDIYKHYEGTVGKRRVSVDLRYGFCGSSNYGGTYVYDLQGNEVRRLIVGQPKDFNHNTPLSANECTLENDWKDANSGGEPKPTWEFIISGDSLTGTRKSADGNEIYVVSLREKYENSYKLDLVSFTDSMDRCQAGTISIPALYNFIAIDPSKTASKADAAFIIAQLYRLTGIKPAGTLSLKNLSSSLSKKCNEDFARKCSEYNAQKTNKGPLGKGSNAYYESLFPVYNDNGLLVVEYNRFSFFRSNFFKSRTYGCLDVKGKMIWKLKDILVVNKDVLTNMLREEFKSKAKVEVAALIPVEKVVPTENIMVMNNGITFCYPIDDPEHFVDEVRIYLSYDKLDKMLTKKFRLRIKR